jgi:hypothetical protein
VSGSALLLTVGLLVVAVTVLPARLRDMAVVADPA